VIYNTLGQEMMRVVDELKPAGRYRVSVDGRNLSSGLYLCRIEAGYFAKTRRILLIR
jgi:hypothetical protein